MDCTTSLVSIYAAIYNVGVTHGWGEGGNKRKMQINKSMRDKVFPALLSFFARWAQVASYHCWHAVPECKFIKSMYKVMHGSSHLLSLIHLFLFLDCLVEIGFSHSEESTSQNETFRSTRLAVTEERLLYMFQNGHILYASVERS